MVNFYCVAIVLACLCIDGAVSQCEVANVCFADATDDDCLPGQVMVPFAGIFGCCPGCQTPSGKLNLIILKANNINA